MEGSECWPHMLRINSNEGNPASEEWWACSCGAAGTPNDPQQPGSWQPTWWGSIEHLVEVGQLMAGQAGENPYAGYDGQLPANAQWAFREDLPAEERRKAREYYGIPAPPER